LLKTLIYVHVIFASVTKFKSALIYELVPDICSFFLWYFSD